MNKEVFSIDEQAIMRQTFKATMLRAADIIDKITKDDVLEAQANLLATGCTLETVAKMDQAHLAAAHLRACAGEEAIEWYRQFKERP